MATLRRVPEADQQKLGEFVTRAVEEVGATLNTALVVMGDKLGLYRALAGTDGLTPLELARRAGVSERYLREWLNAQAAGGYVFYDPASGTYALPPEQTEALANDTSSAYLPGFFQLALGTMVDSPRIIESARRGGGVGWHERHHDVHEGRERFWKPAYSVNLVRSWLPALEGVPEKLEAGATVADVGCGHGSSTILMGEAFPRSSFVGWDSHEPAIQTARKRARQAGLTGRVRFECATVADHPGGRYDLVTSFDCLHEMGDPVGAARTVRTMLAEDGTWMIVEPTAGDRAEDNFTPVGRVYYGLSTLLCIPTSLAQEVGLALGAQAGEARIRDVVAGGGFTRFRRAAETRFNLVFEVRP
jgi:SAM-dependent methyltransferase